MCNNVLRVDDAGQFELCALFARKPESSCLGFSSERAGGTPSTLLIAHPRLQTLWYASFRLCIALGIAWIILSESGASRLDRMIHRFLQWHGWYPVAQLSYAAFLLHPLLIRIVYDYWSPSTVTGVLAAVPLFWMLSLLASTPL